MRINLEHKAAELEETPQNQKKTDLSRRTFLAWLPILGVGCAAATTLGMREADASTETDTAGKMKGLADDEALVEGKKVELVGGVDPDDAHLEFSAQTRGRVRRGARRTGRRVRRTGRRVRRRAVVR